jgi:galactokinase/mevalonate kinase-like predicted kinase
LPDVDVLGLGMWVTPERASRHGVFFTSRAQPAELAFFLQKPSPARLRELAADHLCLVDTGLWLLSARAVAVLMRRCGWDPAAGTFAGGRARRYELYDEFGLSLGANPVRPDAEIQALTSAVVPLPRPEFHHFGTSRQLLESVSTLQNLELDESKLGLAGGRRHPDQYLQNARFQFPLRRDENHTLWVENCTVPATWRLAHDHILTGVPDNDWDLTLEPGVCLDFVPTGAGDFCVRCYGLDDEFRGALGDPGTRWLGRPAGDWFRRRGLTPSDAGASPEQDLFLARLFPVLDRAALDPRYLEWLFAAEPPASAEYARRWREGRRFTAQELLAAADLGRLYAQRAGHRAAVLKPLIENARWSVFHRLDLLSTAELYARTGEALSGVPDAGPAAVGLDGLHAVHEHMFRSAVLRARQADGWEAEEQAAFGCLRDLVVREAEVAPATPRCAVQEDQIVWGRSPVRLDLAGGWTDTPPYCLENGGRVLNLAVNLNGQPPIQVFARPCPEPHFVLRSIDLGAEERIQTHAQLAAYSRPGDEFAVAKAALALAGFLPRFSEGPGFPSLRAHLESLGGGLELSQLAAVPKGSGLGTSSILAATVLATLGDFYGLGWDRGVLFGRTLVLEQLLTTGGGWQDQAGGIHRGVKLIETTPGLVQRPVFRWLPDHLLVEARWSQMVLLYYTGITRVARGILREIVRGIFLNSPRHLGVIEDIAYNVEGAFEAIQRSDYTALTTAVRRSWHLNQALDSGTNPPAVQALMAEVQDLLAGGKLLGAGGGGYLLMFAKDAEAGRRIRERLESRPPNPRARFVDFTISDTGLQVTRS